MLTWITPILLIYSPNFNYFGLNFLTYFSFLLFN